MINWVQAKLQWCINLQKRSCWWQYTGDFTQKKNNSKQLQNGKIKKFLFNIIMFPKQQSTCALAQHCIVITIVIIVWYHILLQYLHCYHSCLAFVALEVTSTFSAAVFALLLLLLFSLGSGIDVTIDILCHIWCNFMHQCSMPQSMQFAALTFGAKMAKSISCIDIKNCSSIVKIIICWINDFK